MQSVIEKDYHPIHADLPMGKLVAEISRSNNNFLPVVDKGGVLLGVIDITRIPSHHLQVRAYNRFTVRQLMLQPSAVLSDHEPMDEVMKKFDQTDAAQLPVVDTAGVLVGYISRTKVYSVYRKIVADMSAEVLNPTVMEKKDLRIVFMGTPEFAVESLKSLVEGGYNVVAVVTQPDKPVGRHQDTLQAPPVKQYALEQGLPVLQPVKMKDPEFVEQLRGFRADLQVVVAFRNAARGGVGHAPFRHVQCACRPVASVSWRSAYQLGCHQWRDADWCHHHLLDHDIAHLDASSCRSLSPFPTMPMWSMSTTD